MLRKEKIFAVLVLFSCLSAGIYGRVPGPRVAMDKSLASSFDPKDARFQKCCASNPAIQAFPNGVSYCHYKEEEEEEKLSSIQLRQSPHLQASLQDLPTDDPSALSEFLSAVVTCGSDGKDDTQCCRDSSVPESCLMFCDGTPPVEVEINGGMIACGNEEVINSIKTCWYNNS